MPVDRHQEPGGRAASAKTASKVICFVPENTTGRGVPYAPALLRCHTAGKLLKPAFFIKFGHPLQSTLYLSLAQSARFGQSRVVLRGQSGQGSGPMLHNKFISRFDNRNIPCGGRTRPQPENKGRQESPIVVYIDELGIRYVFALSGGLW